MNPLKYKQVEALKKLDCKDFADKIKRYETNKSTEKCIGTI